MADGQNEARNTGGKIPCIMRGDTAAAVKFIVSEGAELDGATVTVEYQGVSLQFVNVHGGDELTATYTAEETGSFCLGTRLVTIRARWADGRVFTFAGEAKIKVTDCAAEVYAGTISIDPGTLVVDDLTGDDSLGKVKQTVNKISQYLKGTGAALGLAFSAAFGALFCGCFPAFAEGVQPLTSRFDDVPGSVQIMTNVEEWVRSEIESGGGGGGGGGLGTNEVEDIVGSFASTGTTFRASSVGNAETWTDATGCVWRAEDAWTNSVLPGFVFTMRDNGWWRPSDAEYGLRYSEDSGQWIYVQYEAPFFVEGRADDTVIDLQSDVLGSLYRIPHATRIVGRVALTNDIPPVPQTPADIGAAPASIATTVAELGDTVSAWQTYWDGDDVRVTVTNYYGSLDIPHLYMEQRMPADETHDAAWFKIIWDEMTRWNVFLPGYATLTNHVARDLADRAWGSYDSSTGEYAPDGYTSISSSNILIAAGMAYQKTVTTDGEVWVLTATEPTTISGVTSNGFFRITDGDGNALFEIVKGDKRTVGATAGSISVSGNVIHITYDVVSDNPPTIWCTTDLNSGIWNEVPLIPATNPVGFYWSGESGHWVAELTSGGSPLPPRLFFKATYQLGAETYIKNSAPVGFERVYIGGRSYRVTVETVSGKKLMVLNDD